MVDFKFKRIACSPPAPNNTQPAVQGRVLQYSRQHLVALKVVFQSGSYLVGDTVYVSADAVLHPWSKQVMTLEDKEFVLVPEDLLVAADLITRPYSPYGGYGGSVYINNPHSLSVGGTDVVTGTTTVTIDPAFLGNGNTKVE